MPEIHKAFKFRLYPTAIQEQLLNQTFGCVRVVWNQRVEVFRSWDPEQALVPKKTIKEMKVDKPFLAEVPYNALEQKLLDWEQTKKQYFNKKRKVKLGRPDYKKRNRRQSFRLSVNGFRVKENKIFASKFGKLKLVGHDLDQLPLETCKQITISKEPTGKFFCSVLLNIDIPPKPRTGKMTGIDMGLKELFILSDGTKIDNPKYFRESQAELKKAQQHLSRKTNGSKRRNKQRIKVARIHEKVRNQRKHLLHEVSSKLVTDYDIICVEDLNVKGMVKNHCLAKAISDASWSSFVAMLDYKCNWYGKTLVKIDQWYPSTKTCSSCGHKLDKLGLGVRDWTCPNCGTNHDRDINAAKNILSKGLSDLSSQEFTGVSKKPVSAESVEYKRGTVLGSSKKTFKLLRTA